MVPSILLCTPDDIVQRVEIPAGVRRAYQAWYVDHGVLFRLYWHYSNGLSGMLDHLERLGIDEKSVGWRAFTPHDELIDITERDDIDPRYTRTETPDYVVVIRRHGVEHRCEYTIAEHGGHGLRARSLEEFLSELRLHVGHPDVTVTQLNLVDWED